MCFLVDLALGECIMPSPPDHSGGTEGVVWLCKTMGKQ